MLKTQMLLPRGQKRPLIKRLPLVSLIGTIKVEGLVIRQCVLCSIVLIPTLIRCNQETIILEGEEASLIASTSNRPTSIATLNNAPEAMSPLVRDHPMGATMTLFLMDFQMDSVRPT